MKRKTCGQSRSTPSTVLVWAGELRRHEPSRKRPPFPDEGPLERGRRRGRRCGAARLLPRHGQERSGRYSLFLAHGEALFDKTVLVDVQSTDGTAEIIEASVRAALGRIVRFNCRTQERYQSALMNTLARQAFSEGADWVFCSMPTSFSTSRAGTNFTDPAIHLPGSI